MNSSLILLSVATILCLSACSAQTDTAASLAAAHTLSDARFKQAEGKPLTSGEQSALESYCLYNDTAWGCLSPEETATRNDEQKRAAEVKAKAEKLAAGAKAKQERLIAEARVKQKAGMKLTPKEITLLADSDIAEAQARTLAAQQAAERAEQAQRQAEAAMRGERARQAQAICNLRANAATIGTRGLFGAVLASTIEQASCEGQYRQAGILP